jgi:hypothetical protein
MEAKVNSSKKDLIKKEGEYDELDDGNEDEEEALV